MIEPIIRYTTREPSQPKPPQPSTYPLLSPQFLTHSQTPDYLRLILLSKVYDILSPTPLVKAKFLSSKFGNEIWLKREDLQEVFSFKIRGAYNFMAHIPLSERSKGVITCSAGNHAQGVALSGKWLNIPCTIIMPSGTPSIKVRNVERLGAKVILYGRDFEEAKIECARLARAQQLIFVPPYDHPLVIAGQGTIGMEILRQVPQNRELDGIFVPVGGGGLVSGIAEYVKRISGHHTRVVGIETIDGDAMAQSIAHGSRVVLSEVGLFSDGTAVRVVGEEPFRICKESLDGVTKVNNDEICAAMKDIFEETRSVTEPAGALALAGLKRYIVDNNLIGANKCFVAVVSGANVDLGRLRYVAERAELGEGNEVLMMVDIPELPGKFVALYDMIHPRHVTEFVYRYAHSERAQVLISFRTQSLDRAADVMEVINDLAAKGMTGEDISDNELAKSHLRYLIGGSGKVENERLISFAFPEKPGSLREFLDCIRSDFNISLWHYRNHGGDVEKLLVGIQVPQGSEQKFQAFLSSLRYPYIDETDNMVFKRFMSQT